VFVLEIDSSCSNIAIPTDHLRRGKLETFHRPNLADDTAAGISPGMAMKQYVGETRETNLPPGHSQA
jgi:hypothetical protein